MDHDRDAAHRRDNRNGMIAMVVFAVVVGIVLAVTTSLSTGIGIGVLILVGGLVAVRASGESRANVPPGGGPGV